jgi:succinate-semialdehyde dehydrogenase / glutarate-semialdehyde dehydrogenase
MQLNDSSLLKSQCYINGEWTGAGAIDVVNPATGKAISQVPSIDAAGTRRAIEAAEAAFGPWAKRPPRSAPGSSGAGST